MDSNRVKEKWKRTADFAGYNVDLFLHVQLGLDKLFEGVALPVLKYGHEEGLYTFSRGRKCRIRSGRASAGMEKLKASQKLRLFEVVGAGDDALD